MSFLIKHLWKQINFVQDFLGTRASASLVGGFATNPWSLISAGSQCSPIGFVLVLVSLFSLPSKFPSSSRCALPCLPRHPMGGPRPLPYGWSLLTFLPCPARHIWALGTVSLLWVQWKRYSFCQWLISPTAL